MNISLRLRTLVLAASTLAVTAASAQSVFVKAGLGFASQWGAAGLAGVPKIALGYEHELSQTLAIAPSIGIVGRGWAVPDVETPDLLWDDKGHMLTADGAVTDDPAHQGQRPVLDAEGVPVLGQFMKSMMHRSYSANYVQLDLPVNYYYRLAERRYLTLTAGVWGAVGFAGKRKTEGDGRACGALKSRYTDATFSLDGARRFDCGLKAGFGYQFPSSLTLNLEAEFSLLPTNKVTDTSPLNDAFGARAGRNAALMFTLTYRLNKLRFDD